MKKNVIVVLFLFIVCTLHATILYVPSLQYEEIQDGIDHASEYDTVLVDTGRYIENIDFCGKNITIASKYLLIPHRSYIVNTIIDGDQDGPVVEFTSGEDSTAVLYGFTLTNGNDSGIHIYDSNPTLEYLMITGNSDSETGGGIYCSNADPLLKEITLKNNSSVVNGGGIYLVSASPTIENLTVVNNTSGVGGGIYCQAASPKILNTLVTDNEGMYGICVSPSSYPTIAYCDFYNNEYSNFGGPDIDPELGVDVTTNANGDSCDVYYNIQLDPCFVDTTINNYNLAFDSPCRNAGDPSSPLDPDGTVSDIGNNYYIHKICIPCDYPTIQAAIDDAHNNDTILVNTGTYFENLDFADKDLKVISLFGITQDTSYISQTIIDGNSSGSVAKFNNGEDSTTVLSGFTLTHGSNNVGAGIYNNNARPTLEYLIIKDNHAGNSGGGIYSYWGSAPRIRNVTITGNTADNGGGVCFSRCSPRLNNVTIKNNTALETGGGINLSHSNPTLKNIKITNNTADERGGGIRCVDSSSPNFENVTITYNTAGFFGGGIYFDDASPSFDETNRCNIYLNSVKNSRGYGVDLFANDCNQILIPIDTFTVSPTSDYYVSPKDSLRCSILHSIFGNLIDGDVYVSVDGNNANSGTSASEPFQTISYALSRIYSDNAHSNTIFLAPGTYSESENGETFPIQWVNHVNLCGTDESEVAIDAHADHRVMEFYHVNHALIEDVTITGGSYDGDGGGIYCYKSSPSFEDVTFCGNYSDDEGGAIYCLNSDPSFHDVTIIDNSTYWRGGGMYCNESSPVLKNVLIANNIAAYDDGGGLYCRESSPTLENVTITNNNANRDGGGIFCYIDSSPNILNSIVSDNIGDYGIYVHSGVPTIQYSDFYGNEDGSFYNCGSDIGVNVTTNANGDSCDVYYNIQADPLYLDPSDLDYHLSWTNYPVNDSTKSPCIDAGDPSLPLDPDGTIADMGTYFFDQSVGVDDIPELAEQMFIQYPNPLSSHDNRLVVSFTAQKQSVMSFQIYNIKGQLVQEHIADNLHIGDNTINVDIEKLNSGIYFTKMSVDGNSLEVKKLVILK